MSEATRALLRFGAAAVGGAAGASWAVLASGQLGGSPIVVAGGASVVALALAGSGLARGAVPHGARWLRPALAAAAPLGAAAAPLALPWLLRAPAGSGPALAALLGALCTLPLAARVRAAHAAAPPAPVADAAGLLVGAGLAALLPPWLGLAAAALGAELLASPPRSAAPAAPPAALSARALGLVLAASGLVLAPAWLRGIADPGVGAVVLALAAGGASAMVARGLAPERAALGVLAGAGTLLGAWVLTWKGPGLARMAVLGGVANAGSLPAELLRAAPLLAVAVLLGALAGLAWGPRRAASSAWLALPAGLLLAPWLSAAPQGPLWVAGGLGASAVLWSLQPATWATGLALAGLAALVSSQGGAPAPEALVQPAWRLTRSPDAAAVDAEARAATTLLLARIDPLQGARELRAPQRTWDPDRGAFQPGAQPSLLLSAEGLVVESGGRGASAEGFAGLLGPLLAARTDRVLVLGDDLGLVLTALLEHPVTSVSVATPAPDLVRAVAAADPARKAVWLDARVRLRHAHPEAALRTEPSPDLVIEVLRAPWGDAQHAAASPAHLDAVARALPPDGLYLAAVHLDWFDPGAPAALARALADRFAHVQAWLPPQGADTLLLAASDSPLPLARFEERVLAVPRLLPSLGYSHPDDLASLAVAGGPGLRAWAESLGSAPLRTRLGPGIAVVQRPVLHLASLAPHIDPGGVTWLLDEGDHTELGQKLEARRTFLSLLADATTGDMEAVIQRARELRASGGAVGTAALEPLIDPHLRDARRALEVARAEGLASRSWDEALRYATTARLLAPTSPRPLVLLGDIALGRGKLSTAEEHYAQALLLESDHVAALFGQARVRMALGDHARAEEALREATRKAPAAWETWHTLGIYLADRGQLQEAETCLREAMRLSNGEQTRPVLGLAELMLVDGRLTAALRTADQALEREESGYGWYLRGRAHFELGELDRAEQDFRRAVIMDPGLAEARGGIGLVLWAQGELEPAADAMRAMLAQRPDSSAARENLRRIEEELAARAPPSR